MPYFDYWFHNIVSAAGLISSPDSLTRAWIQKDKSVTSAYDIDELLEQLIGDLRLHETIDAFADGLRHMGALDAVGAFAKALLELEETLSRDSCLRSPENLLASPAWAGIVTLARRITELPAARTYTASLHQTS